MTIKRSVSRTIVILLLNGFVSLSGSGFAPVRAQDTPVAPKLEFAFEVRAQVATPTVVGELQTGVRRIVDILGGTFEGPKLKGKLLQGGADWQLIREDGFTDIDARYTLQTDSGQL